MLVRIEEPEPAPGTACVALAKDHRVPVTLRQPLGDRKVVDAATGKALARS
ncbi:hypothetical protein I3J15_21460 [Streptomyces clavuligerus]|nr:hypothetical protein I3J15_21460 [Streptomyces clavuligerus]